MSYSNLTGTLSLYLNKIYILLLVSSSVTSALPSNQPQPNSEVPEKGTFPHSLLTPIVISKPNSTQLVIAGLVLSFLVLLTLHTRMPKYLKMKRPEKDCRPSPLSVDRPWQIEKLQYVRAEKIEDVAPEKAIPRKAINDIWIEAVQKGQAIGAKRIKSWSESDHNDAPIGATAPACPPLAPGAETCNFGDNPSYHDDGFRPVPIDPQIMGSSPLPPISSIANLHEYNSRKASGHKRATSSPQQVTNHARNTPSHYPPPSQFPLPTLRPATPVTETPASNTHYETPHQRQQEPGPGQVSIFRYSRQYSHKQFQQHRRAHSVPTAEGKVAPTGALNGGNTEGTNAASDGKQEEEFLPVMIFEHGQSVNGQKWRRKVTVFRSEVLQSLEKEGMIICPP
ncbi:hypothetical protein DFH27DRAFT_605405 [Peziza echinospora]|nr:hypothetical protein DFH27DRAFT_605405 [Peziza echinospora]